MSTGSEESQSLLAHDEKLGDETVKQSAKRHTRPESIDRVLTFQAWIYDLIIWSWSGEF